MQHSKRSLLALLVCLVPAAGWPQSETILIGVKDMSQSDFDRSIRTINEAFRRLEHAKRQRS